MRNKVNEFAKNPKKALFTLALPVVIATIVQTLYNIVDTAYVGRLGTEALAAITFSFPLFFILIALNAGINTGMSSRIARFLGERKKKEAENTAMHGLLISAIVALMVLGVGIISLRPLFGLFGATGNVTEMAIDYMSIILFGTLFMFASYVFNGIFSAQGNTKTPMRIMVTSSILNAILDPFFIFSRFGFLGMNFQGLGMGIAGAALATACSFLVGLILFMIAVHKESYLHIHLRNFHFSFKIMKDIFAVGMPSSIMMFLMSIYVIFLNKVMVHFSTNYVAAFGMISRLESVAIMPMVGFSVGLLTLVGMFFGAKRYDLVKKISFYGLKIGVLVTATVGVIFFIFSRLFLSIFTPDNILLDIASPYLRIDVFMFPLMAITMLVGRVMQGLGKGLPGLILNLVRIFVVAIPLAYIFVFVLGFSYLSVAVAMVLGGVSSSIIGIVWLLVKLRKLNS